MGFLNEFERDAYLFFYGATQSVSTTWSSSLSRLQCLHRRLRSSLSMDGYLYREEELYTIHGIQLNLASLLDVCFRMGGVSGPYQVWNDSS